MDAIKTNQVIVDGVFETIREATKEHFVKVVGGKALRKKFLKKIDHYYYAACNPQERKEYIISMYRGWTDVKQWALFYVFDPEVCGNIKEQRGMYNVVADFFKYELDQFLLERNWRMQ